MLHTHSCSYGGASVPKVCLCHRQKKQYKKLNEETLMSVIHLVDGTGGVCAAGERGYCMGDNMQH